MKTTSKMKTNSKTPNPPKPHEDYLNNAGLHTALDIFWFVVFSYQNVHQVRVNKYES